MNTAVALSQVITDPGDQPPFSNGADRPLTTVVSMSSEEACAAGASSVRIRRTNGQAVVSPIADIVLGEQTVQLTRENPISIAPGPRLATRPAADSAPAPRKSVAEPPGSPPAAANETGEARGQSKKRRLGQVLVDAGLITDQDVQRALGVQKMGGGRLGAILVRLKIVSETDIRRALSEQLGIEVADLAGVEPDETVLKLLPREIIKKYEAIPVKVEGNRLLVAMKDPYNFTAIDDIRFYTGMSVVVLACTEGDYARFLEDHLQAQSLIEEILEGGDFYDKAVSSIDSEVERADGVATDEDIEEPTEDELVHDLRLAGEHPPIITLCNFLLVESIHRRASDIHIEPYETFFRVRVRVDGRLQTLITPPQRLHGPMLTRMKIMAEMDIATRRIPQDGHIAIVYRGETCHYRVSTLPTVYGEKCVIRLLKKDETLVDLDKLSFGDELLGQLKKALATPQGILLVTGPTGSGKTTTLHAGLSYINDPETNIVTLEDPVEASLPGINHVQIHEKAGVTFAAGLRSILRQDPDVVFVGEMRDPDVAKIAVKAALTGHLVLSTLHTNSAAESLMRLEDMGVPPYLIANALLMIIAQRLVRKVCKLCRKPYTPSDDEMVEFKLTAEIVAAGNLQSGSGCDACYGTGYHGRMAVYEALIIDNDLRNAIRKGVSLQEVVRLAEANGMKLLFDAGIDCALSGSTTLLEVRRCLSDAR